MRIYFTSSSSFIWQQAGSQRFKPFSRAYDEWSISLVSLLSHAFVHVLRVMKYRWSTTMTRKKIIDKKTKMSFTVLFKQDGYNKTKYLLMFKIVIWPSFYWYYILFSWYYILYLIFYMLNDTVFIIVIR